MDDFREQCRRQLERSVDDRIRYGFFKMYKPILDDAGVRSFETMAEYRDWADSNLPRYLGYKLTNPKNGKGKTCYKNRVSDHPRENNTD